MSLSDGSDLEQLRTQAIQLNREYIEWHNAGELSVFEQKRVKEAINKVLSALSRAESRTNSERFRFVGPPIPPAGAPQRETRLIEEVTREQTRIVNNSVILDASKHGANVVVDAVELSVLLTDAHNVPASVHLQNVTNSIAVINCNGPVFIHGATDSVLIMKCHQLRIHDVRRCSIYVATETNRVIIEKCRDLVFGSYNGSTLGPAECLVDDFDWPTTSHPSPHYTLLTSLLLQCTVPDSDTPDWADVLRSIKQCHAENGSVAPKLADSRSV